jgi:predicted RNA binding protein YcfA (HicA-like mRNA interferase family)
MVPYMVPYYMTRAEKRLAAMRGNPRGDWQLDDLKAVAARLGIIMRHDGGSHAVFRRPDGAMLTVPARRPIKPVYIKHFLAFIEANHGEEAE